jgi:alpha-D-ribose 1-methylphosphonate 5-triphosphate synthase subunit PhnL
MRRIVLLQAEGVGKTFTLHLQGGVRIPVLADAAFTVHAGECLALVGPSGAGKSTLLRSLYGNYRIDAGHIRLRDGDYMVDLASADPRTILRLRSSVIGYVSQFLRVVPRVPALDVVSEVFLTQRMDQSAARAQAATMLQRLNIPPRLHALPPATFSGGEQQRVNLARGFAGRHPILLLDEPTASLDPANRDVVIAMIREAKAAGIGIVGIFHDPAMREAIADREHHVQPLADAA